MEEYKLIDFFFWGGGQQNWGEGSNFKVNDLWLKI